ncbi:hypothetical protein J4416_00580 [Candidatus Pacearchaeota archaeon]|nr:hypothetical protein [Candidatus Pacearchaeota archaeon]
MSLEDKENIALLDVPESPKSSRYSADRSVKSISQGEYKLFVERYLERPKYTGDPQMLTLPSASTFKGVPLLDDF